MPLLAVIVSLPISFNGIGVREGAGIVLFGLVGVERAPAFSLQFLTYLVMVAVSLLGLMVKGLFGNQPIYALLIGGVSLVLAGLCVLRVPEPAATPMPAGAGAH